MSAPSATAHGVLFDGVVGQDRAVAALAASSLDDPGGPTRR